MLVTANQKKEGKGDVREVQEVTGSRAAAKGIRKLSGSVKLLLDFRKQFVFKIEYSIRKN